LGSQRETVQLGSFAYAKLHALGFERFTVQLGSFAYAKLHALGSERETVQLGSLQRKLLKQPLVVNSHRKWNHHDGSAPLARLRIKTSLLNEVNELHLTFQEINKKLDSSLSEMIAGKTLQTQSRLLALQTQMDPHFIYNMLSTLSIMIEDGETREAIGTITHMTRILRYISNGNTLRVTLQEELNIIEHYISCMKIRFGDLLTFSSNLPESMLSLHIPRHSLLPLVENAVKYGWIIIRPGSSGSLVLTCLNPGKYRSRIMDPDLRTMLFRN